MLLTRRLRISTPYFVYQVLDEKWRTLSPILSRNWYSVIGWVCRRLCRACLEDVGDIDASNLLEIEEGRISLPLTGGKVHRGNFFHVIDGDD